MTPATRDVLEALEPEKMASQPLLSQEVVAGVRCAVPVTSYRPAESLVPDAGHVEAGKVMHDAPLPVGVLNAWVMEVGLSWLQVQVCGDPPAALAAIYPEQDELQPDAAVV